MGNLKISYGWNFITARIALGGEINDAADVAELQAAGITHVINCTENAAPYSQTVLLSTCWPQPPQPDDGMPRGAAWFQQGGDFWRANEDKKIYVHCHAGLNRSASMVYYLLRLMGLDDTDARIIIINNRPMDMVGIRYAPEAAALFP